MFETKSCILDELLRNPLNLRSLQYSYYLVLKGEIRDVAETTQGMMQQCTGGEYESAQTLGTVGLPVLRRTPAASSGSDAHPGDCTTEKAALQELKPSSLHTVCSTAILLLFLRYIFRCGCFLFSHSLTLLVILTDRPQV